MLQWREETMNAREIKEVGRGLPPLCQSEGAFHSSSPFLP